MANLQAAIDYVMRQEDPTLSGIVTKRKDKNGRTWLTRYGIDQEFHPELTNSLFYGSMGSTAALAIAENIFMQQYAAPLCVAEIDNQAIGNLLLSLGINCGVGTASRWLQEAADCRTIDGVIGVLTIDALDHADPDNVLTSLQKSAEDYYEEVAAKNPQDREYLTGWLRRIGVI